MKFRDKEAYTNFSRALKSTGREIYFIACFDKWLPKVVGSSAPAYAPPWEWMHPIANAYRLANDHHDNWNQLLHEILIAGDLQGSSHSVAGSFGDWDYLTYVIKSHRNRHASA